jgi:glutathione peroxidase
MITLPIISALLGLGSLAVNGVAADPTPKSFYDFTMTDIDGHKVHLNKFKGKVVLVVNVASQCGFTPQYKGLQAIFEEYKEKGLIVVGFPANNFREQEPGTNAQIKEFCTSKYGVTFPMFSKISVKGDDQASLYKWLIATSDRPGDDIEWNFTKFVIGRDGKVFKRLKPQDSPDSPSLRATLDEALAAH